MICWDAIENPEKLGCRHVFRTDSVETTLTYDNRSPLCKERQGVKGNQPDGKMHVNHSQQSLPGYHGNYKIITRGWDPLRDCRTNLGPLHLSACLHGGWGPQVGEVTRLSHGRKIKRVYMHARVYNPRVLG